MIWKPQPSPGSSSGCLADWTQETSVHALPLPNHLPVPKRKKKKYKGQGKKRFLLVLWTVEMWSQLESGPHHRKEVSVKWGLVERPPLSMPLIPLCASQLSSWCSTIPTVTLLLGHLNSFIIMISTQVFPSEDFSTYCHTCYSTKGWDICPLPLEHLSEFIYLNKCLFSAESASSERAGFVLPTII